MMFLCTPKLIKKKTTAKSHFDKPGGETSFVCDAAWLQLHSQITQNVRTVVLACSGSVIILTGHSSDTVRTFCTCTHILLHGINYPATPCG